MSIIQLPDATVKLLTCSQVITSVSTAVKELIENSLDAGARNIDIKLENNGLGVIEMKDDGIGICKEDTDNMCLPHYTSKINCFDDLENVESYGFRGESLNALCQISDVSITTRTASDDLAMTYSMNTNGHIVDSKPSHFNKGTVVTVSNIFKNLPVRKQFWMTGSRSSEELQKVKTIVKSLGIIHPSLRVCLRHKGSVIWHKHAVSTLKQSAMQAVGYTVATKLHELARSADGVNVDLLVPKKECKSIAEFYRSNIDSIMVFINKRPVRDKKLEKVMLKCIREAFSEEISISKYPICLVSITIAPRQVDVNLEPNKTKVYLKEKDLVLGVVEDMLQLYYGIKPTCLNRSAPVAATTVNGITSDMDCYSDVMDHSDGDEIKMKRLLDVNPPSLESSASLAAASLDGTPPNMNSYSDAMDQMDIDKTGTQGSLGAKRICLGSSAPVAVTSLNGTTSNMDTMDHSDRDGIKMKRLLDVNPPSLESSTSLAAASLNGTPPNKDCYSDAMDQMDFNKTETAGPLKQLSIGAWSRGTLEGPSGNIMQGSHVLLPRARAEVLECDLSIQSASSQLGSKEHSAFTKFSKEVRPKILQEDPGIAFTKVAGLLVKRWNSLSREERESYELLAALADVERKQAKENRARRGSRTLEVKGLLRKMGAPVTVKAFPSRAQLPPKKEVQLDVSMDSIIRKLSRPIRPAPEPSDDITLVGQLRPSGTWVVRKARKLSLLRHWGLKEVVLYDQLMRGHTLPLEDLRTGITLDERILGEELWKLLLSLKKTYNVGEELTTIMSAGIAKNGFRVELKERGGHTTCVLKAVSSTIGFYGVADLRQALTLVRHQGEDESRLHHMRPLKVMNYIRDEAVRLCRQGPAQLDSETLENLVKYWRERLEYQQCCLHHKPILAPIHTLT